jgi:hypothetical protein
MLDSPLTRAFQRNVSVLEDELLENVAVEGIDGQDLIEANENFFLYAVCRVDEGGKFLAEVNCLIDGHLGSFFLILLKQHSQRSDHHDRLQNFELINLEVLVKLRELRQKVVEGLNSAGAENFV